MKIKQMLLIITFIILIPCITSIGIYVRYYKNVSDLTSIKKGENQEMNKISILYETDSGEYVESSASTWPIEAYVFNEKLSRCDNGSKLIWDDINQAIQLNSKISDKCYVYFDKKPTLSEYIKSTYVSNALDQTLLYHNNTLTNGAGDESYRYSGANPNNYVCFGTDAAPCPEDNLYRIIGVFDDDNNGIHNVKLIKSDFATSDQLGINGSYSTDTYNVASYSTYKGNKTIINRYKWNATNTNIWSASELNTINLNTNYVNYITLLGEKWINKIVDTTWQVAGNSFSKIYNVSVAQTYQNEIKSPSVGIFGNGELTYDSKIGLMYVSDYGYATSQDNWTITLFDYDTTTVRDNNWMYMGIFEWSITRLSGLSNLSYFIYDIGFITSGSVSTTYAVRPTFYLESSVQLKSGAGTQTDPYRLL